MHICILSSRNICDHKNWGGVHTHLSNLVTVLIELGHNVSLITNDGEKIFRNGSLQIIPACHHKDESNNNKCISNILKNLHKGNYIDCIFSEGVPAKQFIKLSQKLRIPIIAFVHNLYMHYFYNNWQEVEGLKTLKSYIFRSVPIYIYGMFFKDIPSLRRCDYIISGSGAISFHIRKIYRISANRILPIHNWVDDNKFQRNIFQRKATRQIHRINEDNIIFLMIGCLWRPKGFRTALKAFHRLAKITPQARLWIIGEGPDRFYIQKYINKYSLTERIKLFGFIPNSDLPSFYSAADVFILPSLLNEVLPYTLLEAMSCELPIIASDISASREALGNSANTFQRGDMKALFDLMHEFTIDINLRKKEAVLQRERVLKNYSFEAASVKIEQLMKKVICL